MEESLQEGTKNERQDEKQAGQCDVMVTSWVAREIA